MRHNFTGNRNRKQKSLALHICTIQTLLIVTPALNGDFTGAFAGLAAQTRRTVFLAGPVATAACLDAVSSFRRLALQASGRSSGRGRQCFMRRYFYGVKVQVLTTVDGLPVECCFVPGSEHDLKAQGKLPLEVAVESRIYADAAYTGYQAEDDLLRQQAVRLLVSRKANSKMPDAPCLAYPKEQMRKGIETTFSSIKALFPHSIHAVTFDGFLLKLLLFLFAFTLNELT